MNANDRLIQSAQLRRSDPLLAELLTLYESSRSDPVQCWLCDRVFRQTAWSIALRCHDWRQLVHLMRSHPSFWWRGVLLRIPTK